MKFSSVALFEIFFCWSCDSWSCQASSIECTCQMTPGAECVATHSSELQPSVGCPSLILHVWCSGALNWNLWNIRRNSGSNHCTSVYWCPMNARHLWFHTYIIESNSKQWLNDVPGTSTHGSGNNGSTSAETLRKRKAHRHLIFRWRSISILFVKILITSCSVAPLAPHHAASRHGDQHYGQSRNIKYSTFHDPGG